MHELCKDLGYVAVMVDLLISTSEEGLSAEELRDLGNMVAEKAQAVINMIAREESKICKIQLPTQEYTENVV
jgi:hypothetical protein